MIHQEHLLRMMSQHPELLSQQTGTLRQQEHLLLVMRQQTGG